MANPSAAPAPKHTMCIRDAQRQSSGTGTYHQDVSCDSCCSAGQSYTASFFTSRCQAAGHKIGTKSMLRDDFDRGLQKIAAVYLRSLPQLSFFSSFCSGLLPGLHICSILLSDLLKYVSLLWQLQTHDPMSALMLSTWLAPMVGWACNKKGSKATMSLQTPIAVAYTDHLAVLCTSLCIARYHVALSRDPDSISGILISVA